jgi:replication factor A1
VYKLKIEELNPNSRGIEMTIQVVEKKEQRDVTTRDGTPHQVAEFLVGDETGCILLSLWDDAIEKAEVGKSYKIGNAFINVFRNSMRISLGRQGTMDAAEEEVKANTANNLSDKHVENPRFTGRGGFGGGRSGGFNRRRF